MKVSAISGDMLVQLALIAAGVGLVLYLVRRSGDALAGAVDAVSAQAGEVADSIIVGVNPSNPSNWINQAVTSAGDAVVSSEGPGRSLNGSWSLGAWLYDVTHADPVGPAIVATSAPAPSYGAEPTGAAFGFFPHLAIGRNAQVQSELQTIATRGRVVGGL